jgi:hypothetical protein
MADFEDGVHDARDGNSSLCRIAWRGVRRAKLSYGISSIPLVRLTRGEL